jgi:hypothetical protein
MINWTPKAQVQQRQALSIDKIAMPDLQALLSNEWAMTLVYKNLCRKS